MRIAHIALQLDTGGMERLLTEFARHADRTRFDLWFISLGSRGTLAGVIESYNWPVIAMDMPRGVRPRLAIELAKVFRAERIDVVHTHNTRPLLYAAPAARLAGVAGVIHTRHGQRCNATARHDQLFRLAAHAVDRMVCVSQDSRQRSMDEGVRADRLHTIWNGVDPDAWPFQPCDAAGPAVFVGRLSPEKDVATLLRAVAIVAQRSAAFQLQIVGDGPCRADLERLAGDLGVSGRVKFLGEVREPRSILQRASVFVLPSVSEGLPVTALEAMATGLPVVATRVGGTPEVVMDGLTGLLVPAGDAGELAAAIGHLISAPDLARRMGEEGRRRIVEQFDIRTMVARYEALYDSVARRTQAAAA